ncbi:unnamed protein product [Paramecium sonneborni]|uniref:Uncharacterized protein n=1 Tax=Paramecium sonneborni TaxID=65129 RepID=A0A8S1Q2M0_9CILI|nr:unnamed protein product [Paramecium sonneborni]
MPEIKNQEEELKFYLIIIKVISIIQYLYNDWENLIKIYYLKILILQKAFYMYQQCSKHSKKIIMVNLNQVDQGLSPFACTDCIQEFPIQYITLEEANNRQNLQKRIIKGFNQSIQFKKKKAIKQFCIDHQKLKDHYNQTLKNNNDDIFTTKKFNSKDLFLQDEKKLQQIIKLLSSNNQTNYIIDILRAIRKIRLIYLLFYSNLKTKLGNIMKEDLLFNQIKEDNKNALDSEVHEFILKVKRRIYILLFLTSLQNHPKNFKKYMRHYKKIANYNKLWKYNKKSAKLKSYLNY